MTERPVPLSFADLGVRVAPADIPSEIPMVETVAEVGSGKVPLRGHSWADIDVRVGGVDPREADEAAPGPIPTGSVDCDASITLEGPEARRFIDTLNEHLAAERQRYSSPRIAPPKGRAPAPIAPANRSERKVWDCAWTDEAPAALIAYRRAVRTATEKRAKRARAMRAARLARRKGRRP